MTGFGIVGRTDGRTGIKLLRRACMRGGGADTEEWEAVTLGPL